MAEAFVAVMTTMVMGNNNRCKDVGSGCGNDDREGKGEGDSNGASNSDGDGNGDDDSSGDYDSERYGVSDGDSSSDGI